MFCFKMKMRTKLAKVMVSSKLLTLFLISYTNHQNPPQHSRLVASMKQKKCSCMKTTVYCKPSNYWNHFFLHVAASIYTCHVPVV